ncbi:MAG: LysR family transcriptional regulator, partial [Pseudomonadota bacterium]
MQGLNWSDLEVALAVARHGSLVGAARALRVDGATVSRRIARLRGVLGGPLFHRGSDRVLTPTDLGRDVADRAEAMETEIIRLLETARGADQMVQGLVRLTSTPLIVNRLLTPASPALLTAYPGLQIELNAEPADLSLTKRDADMALRLARP